MDWQLVADLAQPFPASLIRKPPPGKHGDYIKHSDVNQRMLAIVGLHDFQVQDLIRGFAPEIVGRDKTWAARENAVVGVVASMTIRAADGSAFTVTEIGTEDTPAMSSDSENAKNAISDAYKRCAMRFGLGLHMWSPDTYFLEALVTRRLTPAPQEEAAQDGADTETEENA